MSISRQRDVALVALTTRAIPASTQPLSSREVRSLLRAEAPDALLGSTADEVGRRLGVDPATSGRLANLLARAASAAQLLESWEHHGIWIIHDQSPEYPERLRSRLGDQAPVILHGLGDPGVLSNEGIGVVGSRNLAPQADLLAHDIGIWAASRALTLFSGGARGADRSAGISALNAGGLSTWVVAEGLRRAVGEPVVRTAIMADRLVVCSPYHPDAAFTAGAAMGRNKLVYALAGRTTVVASDHGKGGTWAGATEAMKRDYGQVMVYRGEGEGPGNAELEALGATPFSSATDLDNPPRGATDLDPQPQSLPSPPEQLSFDV